VAQQVKIDGNKMSSSDENRLGIAKHRDIYDLVQGFIGLLSPDGTVLDANKSALDLIGVQLDDVVGLKFWTTPWWRVCQKSRLALKDAIRRGASGQPSHFEARVGDKNGEIVDINFSLTPIINKAGVVVSLVPEGHDITARKQAKTALQESEARLHLAYDAAEMGTWDWDFAEDYLHWSDRQFELFGMPKKSRHLRLEDALTTVHPDDRERVKTAVAMSAENDLPFREEFRVVHNTGEVRWLVGQGNILHHSESGRPKSLIGVNYDITKRKRLEIKLAQSNSELEARVADRSRALEEEMRERQKVEGALAHSQRFELIGQLAGGVAHDFNNFLAVIGGNLELAAMRTADKRIVELINEAMEAVEAGASLNRRLLSFAREHVLEPVALAVNDRITKTRPLLERTLGANIELVTELEPDLWQTTADSGEFDVWGQAAHLYAKSDPERPRCKVHPRCTHPRVYRDFGFRHRRGHVSRCERKSNHALFYHQRRGQRQRLGAQLGVRFCRADQWFCQDRQQPGDRHHSCDLAAARVFPRNGEQGGDVGKQSAAGAA
jgi:PAS domain S-box-containing protein